MTTEQNGPESIRESQSAESGGWRGRMGSIRKKVAEAIESDESGRLRGAVDSARDAAESAKAVADSASEKIKRPIDVISLAEFRTEFEHFTQAVSTAVIGVHQDQSTLSERLDRIEERLTRLEQLISKDQSYEPHDNGEV